MPVDSAPLTAAGARTAPVDFLARRSRFSSQAANIDRAKLTARNKRATIVKLAMVLAP